jgi:hypothetical protein
VGQGGRDRDVLQACCDAGSGRSIDTSAEGRAETPLSARPRPMQLDAKD